jgi:Holliday junction resolvase-like predicted endonuclease
MAALKEKGDLAELRVAADLVDRGCRLSLPYGEDCDYDLIADKDGILHRIQVKYTQSDGRVIGVRCMSHSLTNGKVRQTKHYTAKTIDWIAVYDRTSDRCYYLPASELGSGRSHLHLRLAPAKNGQSIGIRQASDYLDPALEIDPRPMEPAGLEPATFRMQTERSSS